jgi:Ca2+-binding EF-hand superfamily protein
MLAALGAATSLLDALQSVTKSKSPSAPSNGTGQTPADPFEITGTGAPASSAPSSGGTGFSPIAPQTMSALIDAQSQASSTSPGSAGALQDLFSQIDGNGDGKLTKSEFENALGAGGTNLTQADDVFGKLDQNSDGSVDLDELKRALQGSGHHGHHHHQVGSASDSSSGSATDGTGTTSDPSADPLMQALNASLSTAAGYNSGLSASSLTRVDTSSLTKVSLDAAGTASSSYTAINQLMQREAQAMSASMATSLSINV